jgi:tRNA pseudouridine(38-40) synthase
MGSFLPLVMLNCLLGLHHGISLHPRIQYIGRPIRKSLQCSSNFLPEITSSFSKRKLALIISYDGSGYYGLQMDPGSPLRTIESELEAALFSNGCILESNRGDLGKIQWSRSSRTDKSVHAACLCISAKFEIDLDWIQEDKKLPHLKGLLNTVLPPEIRVLSVVKVNQGFQARTACSWREYEYLLPTRLVV